MAHNKIDYQKFVDFSIKTKLVKLTSGDDGDTMYQTSPNTQYDTRYKGYRIQNTSLEGGFYFEVWSMLDGKQINIPYQNCFDITILKQFIDNNLADLTPQIEEYQLAMQKAAQEQQAKALARKAKNEHKFYGWSSTTYYKVRRIVEAPDNPKLTEQLTKLVLTNCRGGGNCEERATMVNKLFQLGLIKITNLNKLIKI